MKLNDLLNRSPEETKAYLTEGDKPERDQAIGEFARELGDLMSLQDPDSEATIARAVAVLLDLGHAQRGAAGFRVLCEACFFYRSIGQNYPGIAIATRVLESMPDEGDRNALRRVHSVLGVLYLDVADFTAAMPHLEESLRLAVQLDDPVLECASIANAMVVLKEMGLYHDALKAADQALLIRSDSWQARLVRFQAAGNALFCAHRLRDHRAALRYLTEGSALLETPEIDAVSKATFESYRALYLIDTQDAETAETLLEAAQLRLASSRNPRVSILLGMPRALCDVASGAPARIAQGKKSLRELYDLSKRMRLYHDDVLRALMSTFGRGTSPLEAHEGMQYAKELVEFTTQVKRAKFYRQMSERGFELDPGAAPALRGFDALSSVRQWLTPAEKDRVQRPVLKKSGSLEKNDELHAIYEDLARLRAAAMRKGIRTLAYDTAENWALAAEFFDDQTGQHCFRVGHLAAMLAREAGMDTDFCVRIEHAARLHDIGKIAVNEMILLKPGPLDPSELTAMRAHSEVGAYLLHGSGDPTLQMAATIAHYHHEWWNGAGYPTGIAHTAIPLPARICALADVYDALTNVRPYKGAWPHELALEEMQNLSGTQFDPDLMAPFKRVLERYLPALAARDIPGLRDDLPANALIASRKNLMEAICGPVNPP